MILFLLSRVIDFKALKGVDEAWEQHKQGKGKRITSDEELDAFIDSL